MTLASSSASPAPGVIDAPASSAGLGVVRTVRLDDAPDLLAQLPDEAPLAWVRDGDGMVGWGEAARVLVVGPDRFIRADRWWRDLTRGLDVDDAVRVPGTGPVAFGSFTFGASSAGSVLVVPRVVVGRRGAAAWLTTIGDVTPALRRVDHPARPSDIRYADGSQPVTRWTGTVAEAVRRIRAGAAEKVVLARDLLANTAEPVDVRYLLHRLADRFPECWTFACAGMTGATPELLVRRTGRRVESRVLAGTAGRGRDDADDVRLAAELLASEKDLAEHAYAVDSVRAALAPRCAELNVAPEPEILRLANVQHLSTDVAGRLAADASALEVTAALHPTAAVCGTPTEAAYRIIDDLEDMDRGRYAGPVGWTDADGNGEWGIALRCAAVDGRQVRLFAGCGIVADSDPEAELAESQVKLAAMRDALEGAGS